MLSDRVVLWCVWCFGAVFRSFIGLCPGGFCPVSRTSSPGKSFPVSRKVASGKQISTMRHFPEICRFPRNLALFSRNSQIFFQKFLRHLPIFPRDSRNLPIFPRNFPISQKFADFWRHFPEVCRFPGNEISHGIPGIFRIPAASRIL